MWPDLWYGSANAFSALPHQKILSAAMAMMQQLRRHSTLSLRMLSPVSQLACHITAQSNTLKNLRANGLPSWQSNFFQALQYS
mmetsp:Transcript_22817/g.34381  ORF Transcript_22817/g.34381 Transcript_22817/m.34381 type:complete len:83 (+) Transcript_22817:426-674(+)